MNNNAEKICLNCAYFGSADLGSGKHICLTNHKSLSVFPHESCELFKFKIPNVTPENMTLDENSTPQTKVCKRCGKNQPIENFYANAKAADGLQCYCKACKREMNREFQRKNRYKDVKALNPALEDFQPNELIAELRARGYYGELKVTKTVKV